MEPGIPGQAVILCHVMAMFVVNVSIISLNVRVLQHIILVLEERGDYNEIVLLRSMGQRHAQMVRVKSPVVL